MVRNVQSFVNTILYCFMLVCFHVIAPLEWLSSNRFTSFLATTFIWEISHALGGVILVGFNREIRRRILHPRDLLNSETIQAKATNTIQNSILSAQPVYKTAPSQMTTVFQSEYFFFNVFLVIQDLETRNQEINCLLSAPCLIRNQLS